MVLEDKLWISQIKMAGGEGAERVGRIQFCSIIVARPDKPRFKADCLLSILSEPDKISVEAGEKLSAHCSEIWMMLLLCTYKKA